MEVRLLQFISTNTDLGLLAKVGQKMELDAFVDLHYM
jgi:hypothetical protein